MCVKQVHVRGVEPHEPRFAGLLLALDEVLRGGDELVVAGLHALLVERAGVLDLLLADLAPARHHRRVVLVGGPGMDHAARPEVLRGSSGILSRVVLHLRLFLGVQVVEVAEELVEAVVGRQHVVHVAQVVLAELAGGVALLLEERRDRHELVGHADRRGRDADLGQAGAVDALPGDERRPPGGAGLLAVRIGEHHAFPRDTIDVRRLVAHQPVGVAAQVRDADVVTPDHENVRLPLLCPRRRRLLCHVDLRGKSELVDVGRVPVRVSRSRESLLHRLEGADVSTSASRSTRRSPSGWLASRRTNAGS